MVDRKEVMCIAINFSLLVLMTQFLRRVRIIFSLVKIRHHLDFHPSRYAILHTFITILLIFKAFIIDYRIRSCSPQLLENKIKKCSRGQYPVVQLIQLILQ